MADTKLCSRCGQERSRDQFYKRARSRDGLQSHCKACQKVSFSQWKSRNPERYAETLKRWKERNPEHHLTDQTRDTYLQYHYNIGLDQYNFLLEVQGGVCACCGVPPTSKRNCGRSNLAVDHCHETGVVRGLLCFDCNVAIGKLGDTASGVRRALDYLESGGSA